MIIPVWQTLESLHLPHIEDDNCSANCSMTFSEENTPERSQLR